MKYFGKRLEYEYKFEDLSPLLKIEGVNHEKAALLYKAGYKTIEGIALSKPQDVLDIERLKKGDHFVPIYFKNVIQIIESAKQIMMRQLRLEED